MIRHLLHQRHLLRAPEEGDGGGNDAGGTSDAGGDSSGGDDGAADAGEDLSLFTPDDAGTGDPGTDGADPGKTEDKPADEAPKDADPSAEAEAAAREERRRDIIARREAAAKRETEAQQRDRQLKEREARVAAIETAIQSADPGAALKALGFNDDAILDHLAAQAGDEDPVKSELAAIRAKLEQSEKRAEAEAEERKRAEAQAAAERQRAENDNLRKRVHAAVTAGGEKYELLNALGKQDLVYQIADEYFKEHKTAIDFETAAKAAEKVVEDDLEKASKTKKFQAKYATKANGHKSDEKAKAKNGKTLGGTGAGGTSETDDDLPLDPRARHEILSRRMSVMD